MAQGHLQEEGEKMEVLGDHSSLHLTVSLTLVRRGQPQNILWPGTGGAAGPFHLPCRSFTPGSCSFGCLLACTCSHLLPSETQQSCQLGAVHGSGQGQWDGCESRPLPHHDSPFSARKGEPRGILQGLNIERGCLTALPRCRAERPLKWQGMCQGRGGDRGSPMPVAVLLVQGWG